MLIYANVSDSLELFQFGSWTYDGTKVELQIDENGLDISNYMKNGEWHLVCKSAKFR